MQNLTNKARLLLLLFMGLFVAQLKVSAGPVNDAWSLFLKNDYDAAKAKFEESLGTPEASLGLAFIAWHKAHFEEAYSHMKVFIQTTDDPMPYLYAFWVSPLMMDGLGKKNDEKLEFLNSLYEHPDADETIKGMISYMIGSHYMETGDWKDSEESFKKLAMVNKYQVCGGFENISKSGFDKTYPPILAPEPDAVFKNVTGADIKWFKIPVFPRNCWVSMSNYDITNDRIFYLQSFVESPKQQEVILRLGVSGSVKVWMNDKLILSEKEERDNYMDTYMIKTRLNQGNNRMLIQLGSSEISDMNVAARFTTPDGKVIDNLVFSDVYKAYDKEKSYESTLLPNKYVDFFKQKIETAPDNFVNYIILAEMYGTMDYKEEALETLLKAEKLAPESSFIKARLLEVYAQRSNRTRLAELIEWMRNNDENNYYALNYRYSEALGNEDYDEAEAIIETIKKEYGETELYYTYQIAYLSANDKSKEMIETMEEAFLEYPENLDFLYYRYLLYKEIEKNPAKGEKLLKKYLKKNYSADILSQLAAINFEKGYIDKGLDYLKSISANDPSSGDAFVDLANTYFQLQMYEKATENMQIAVDMAPYYGYYWGELANIYEQRGFKTKAIDLYEKCITLSPTYYDARTKLQNLKNEKSLFENIEAYDIDEMFAECGDSDQYPEDNSVLFLHDVQVVVYPEGGSEEKQTIGVKVLDNKGVDDFKEYYIGYNGHTQRLQIEKAEVLKENGNKIPAEISGNHIVFTDLEPGDGIHIIYKLKNYYDGLLLSNYWDKHSVQKFLPVVKDRYTIIFPKDKPLQYKLLNDDTQPQETEVFDEKMESNYTEYSWVFDNVESAKQEDLMPNISDFGPVLFISTIQSWNDVAKWYKDLTENMIELEIEGRMVLDELFPEGEAFTDREKVQKIYDYIVENIRYSSVSFRQSAFVPQKTTKTLNTRLGDCKDVSLLFVSMCREVGIPAELVLINTRDNGKNDMPLPSIHFNHVIARVWLDDEVYYVEMTSDRLPFATLTYDVRQAISLDVNNATDTFKYLNPETLKDNVTNRNMTVDFADNKMIVTRENYKTGTKASSIRSSYRDKGIERQMKDMTESITGDFDTYLELKELDFRGLDGTSDTVFYDYTFEVSDPFNKVGSLNLFSLPWSDAFFQVDFLSNSERKYPIQFWNFDDGNIVTENITMTIPSDMKLYEVPESVDVKSKYADYSIKYELKGNKLYVTRHCDYKESYIPVDEYNQFKEFYQKVLDADTQQLAFKKK